MLNGNDGGMNVSWDGGTSWIKCNSPSVGQFYAVEVDDAEPYNVYGGLQDNGTWKGPHTHKENPAWHQTGQHPYRGLGGGDGMQIEVDRRNADIVFTGYQFGWYRRTNLATGNPQACTPPTRWGDSAPVELADAHLAEPAPTRHLVHGVQQASPLHGPGRNLGNPQRGLDPWRTCWKCGRSAP